MLKRIYYRIRDHFRSEESKWAEARQAAYMIRDMVRDSSGIEISDEEIELNIRFQKVVQRNRKKECFDEWLRAQMYAYLTLERKAQLVAELEGMD